MSDTDHLGAGAAVSTRPLRFGGDGIDPVDLETVVALVQATDLATIGAVDSGANDIAGLMAFPTMDRDASFLALDGDTAVGFVFVEDDVTAGDTFVDLYAPPGPWQHAVHEVGLRRGIEAAHRHRLVTPGSRTVRSGAWTANTALIADLEAHGLAPVRSFHRMRIDSGSPAIPLSMPSLPVGVEIVVCDDEATRRRICDVDNETFLDHWHFTPRPFAEWWSMWESSPARDPEGWWLLTVDGVDAAVCLLDESRADLGDGYVALLGVRRQFRGRGLAQLLLRRAFVHYRELGRGGTQLGVDAENLTGAMRLYEGVGMTALRTVQSHALELA